MSMVAPISHPDIAKRLKRPGGHLKSIVTMLQQGRGCLEIAQQPIHFTEAIVVAVAGLAVHVACAVILSGAHDHDHAHDQREHAHHHPGLNLRSACLHVVADAATSVLAILALASGMLYGSGWLDPVMGIVGARCLGRCGRAYARSVVLQRGQ